MRSAKAGDPRWPGQHQQPGGSYLNGQPIYQVFISGEVYVMQNTSDVDPDLDPVGSVFIWVRGYKIRGKQSLTKKILGFFWRKLYFSKKK